MNLISAFHLIFFKFSSGRSQSGDWERGVKNMNLFFAFQEQRSQSGDWERGSVE